MMSKNFLIVQLIFLNFLFCCCSASQFNRSDYNSSSQLLLAHTVYNASENVKLDPRITGGERAQYRGHEHLVSIRLTDIERRRGFGNGHVCGGSLIKPNVVLTAAHCLFYPKSTNKWNPSDLVVVMGILNRMSSLGASSQNVKKVVPHPHFSPQNFKNDIGLLILSNSFALSSGNIKLIDYSNTTALRTGDAARISGWGATSNNEHDTGSPYLLTALIRVIDHGVCRKLYANVNYIADSMFCARDGINKDSCQGDSGGPLVGASDNRQYGVVSWGNKCGLPDFPGVYTNVMHYSKWIRENSAYKTTISIVSILIFLNFHLLLSF